MNREIKFRGFDVEGKRMHSIAFQTWNGMVSTWKEGVPQTTEVFFSEDGPEVKMVLMQFTGLKDKNGAEIYEGDIITAREFSNKRAVDFTIGAFGVEDFHLHQLDGIEIIGNIYETPELLK